MLTKSERRIAVDIIMEGVNKLEERNKANYKRGLLTADEEQKNNTDIYRTMKELITMLLMDLAA